MLALSLSLSAVAKVQVVNLTCEHFDRPLAIDSTTPHFSWQINSTKAGDKARSYRIQVASDSLLLAKGVADLWDSGVVESDETVLIPYAGKPLKSLDRCWWRVVAGVESTKRSITSPISSFGIGIIDEQTIASEFIANRGSGATAAFLRSGFEYDGEGRSVIMHVNSLGYHEVWINGRKVGDACIAPALSQLNKRSLWVAYDVKEYLQKGRNDIVVWLGQGWYKRHTFGRWQPELSYAEPMVRLQIHSYTDAGQQLICRSGEGWRSTLSGYRDTGSWNALDFGGEEVDARRNPLTMDCQELDKLQWSDVMVARNFTHKATPQMVQPDRIYERLSIQSARKCENGVWMLDFGKVITGWFELRLSGLKDGECIKIEYSDELDENGNLQDQRQSDLYIARGGATEEVFCNKFNHHAYRYVRITGLKAEPATESAHALAFSTAYSDDASFVCSDEDVNAIHDMIERTMRCLAYNGYMVDCPHLERAGYGGDGNSSTQILQTLCGTAPLFRNWIQAWADAMREGGSLPHVSPNAGAGGGGPYWCGFMVMAPWHTFLNYRDITPIERYYENMKLWIEFVESHFKDGLKERWADTPYRDWYLGDWLAPWGVDAGNGDAVKMVNNCFISDCYARMVEMATLLGRDADAKEYAASREKLNSRIHERFYNAQTHTYAAGSQLDMVYPMLVGATPRDKVKEVRERLMKYSHEVMKDHIGGGLVGVPLITRWAIEAREPDFIYRMLKQRDYPGYLYMIDNGATATWEYWSGERSRVHNCYNGIGTWFYQALGGLRTAYDAAIGGSLEASAGYRRVVIEPQVPAGVEWCSLTKQSPYGEITVDWRLTDGEMTIEVGLPVGVEGQVAIPQTAKQVRLNKREVTAIESVSVVSGRSVVSYKL